MKKSDIPGTPDAEFARIGRELGTKRMDQVISRLQEAQSSMDLVAIGLSGIIGSGADLGRALKVSAQIRDFWGRLEELKKKLASADGPRATPEFVQFELRLRQQQK